MISDVETHEENDWCTYVEGLEQVLFDQSSKGPYPETRGRIEAQNHRGCFQAGDKLSTNARSHFDVDKS